MEERPRAQSKRKRQKGKIKRFLLPAGVIVLCLLSALLPPLQAGWHTLYRIVGLGGPKSDGFTVHFLDVGSADAIILHCGETTILVDAGTVDCGTEICRYLRRMGVETLTLAVNTHPDKDHLGGFVQVLREFPPQAYWEPEVPEDLIPASEEYSLTRAALEEMEIPVSQVGAGVSLSLGPMALEVLGPVSQPDDSNNGSLVLKASYAGRSVLLMGDAEESEEEDILDSGAEVGCDVLKVGHHGSKTSTSAQLLQQARPQYAVISAGSGRPPNEEVLQRLQENSAEVYRTDTQGSIVLSITEEGLTFYTEK